MRALLLDRIGAPDALRLGELETPEPAAGHVRVRIAACGLNPSDYQRAAYGVPEWTWPAVVGLDGAGVVDALGDGVSGFSVGQRVVFHADIRDRGALAEFAIADARVLTPIPDEVSWVEAAALPAAGLTAYCAIIQRLRVGPGDTVLVTGAAGGVGGYAVQLSRRQGARVIGTESAANAATARALGADEVIDFRSEDIGTRVRELTGGRGVDAVLDTVGSASATENIQLLAFSGRIATIAGRPDISVVAPFGMAPSVHEVALGAAYFYGSDRDLAHIADMLGELLDLVARDELDPMVARVVPLEQAPTALGDLAERRLSGKCVVGIRPCGQ